MKQSPIYKIYYLTIHPPPIPIGVPGTTGLIDLKLPFTHQELNDYMASRQVGLSSRSVDWIKRAGREVWNATNGIWCRETATSLRTDIIAKFRSTDSHTKVLAFGTAFLKHLTKTRFDERYASFAIYLERPKSVKARKTVTSRIVTIRDIRSILGTIHAAMTKGTISNERADEFTAFILLGCYTGQRPQSTLASLTVGQVRAAVSSKPPIIHVRADQDKIRMEHYVPVHPSLVPILQSICEGRSDHERLFVLAGIQSWLKRNPVHLSRCPGVFTPSDCRKFAEQYGDILGWEQSNRSYILAHGVGGIEWAHYRSPLPEYVYANYMKYWGDVDLINHNQPVPHAIMDENIGALQEYPVLPMHS